MSKINLLNQETIDKIAAGEVIERPSSVVKELVENAIDAGSTAITVEIKEGGISFIRITDNGCGIAQDEVSLAFLRHSTSKIKSAEDLLCVRSLGFRGEALSSIAAIARVELITKTAEALTGTRYQIEGSREISVEEIGAPDGTTFLVRDLFFNTPARRKFLKTPQTEGTYISDMLEKLALSHPDISFKYINNNQTRLHTSGNGNRKDLIYHIYGRDIAASLMEVQYEGEYFSMSGYIGKPVINRGNRNYENYFINGRYIKSVLLSKAIEEAYKSFLMQHQYPFTVLYFRFPGDSLDVNVHPTKMELRFENNQEIYKELCEAIYEVLSHKELIPDVPIVEAKNEKKPLPVYKEPIPEPFEKRRINQIRSTQTYQPMPERKTPVKEENISYVCSETVQPKRTENPAKPDVSEQEIEETTQVTLESVSPEFLTKDARKKHRIIGQLFQTYWLIEYEDKLYIIDQHAAHEKVNFERLMRRLSREQSEASPSQMLAPPIILTLSGKEEAALLQYMDSFRRMGYEIESFGAGSYAIRAVPLELYANEPDALLREILDEILDSRMSGTPAAILYKIASMSCKAAVKGNMQLSAEEAKALIDELLSLDNPYHCPHGRPTMVVLSKQEMERKFKRIV